MNFKNLPLNLKITSLLLILAVASGASAFYASSQMVQIDTHYSSLLDGPAKGATTLARSRRALSGIMIRIFQNITATTEEGNRAAMAAREKDEERFAKQFVEARAALPALKTKLDEQEQKYKAAMTGACAEVIRAANASTDPAANTAIADSMNRTCIPVLTEISEVLGKLIDEAEKRVDEENSAATDKTNSTRYTLLIAIALATVASIGLAIVVSKKFITAPSTA